MSDYAASHRQAASRHEMAAETHERAASFWEDQHDPQRAGLQREMAEYERHGAELERRWADLIEPDAIHRELHADDLVVRQTRHGAKRASGILAQLANALDRSASLAETHAQRLENAGRADNAGAEREAATRAREVAQRARSQAEEWLKVGKGRST